MLFGCISWALGTLFTKYASSGKDKSNPITGSAWQMIFASAMFWIFALFTKETETVEWDKISAQSWTSLIYLILFGSLLAYSAYIWLLQVRPAAEVGTHAYINPFVAILIGTAFGREVVTSIQIGGLALILLSIMFINKRANAKTTLENQTN